MRRERGTIASTFALRVAFCFTLCFTLSLTPAQALAQGAEAAAASPPALPVRAARDGQHDFDSHLGEWRTELRLRLRPLTGSTEWAEYKGTSIVRPVWDGRANLVELDVIGPTGRIEALALRLYDPTARQWSLNFANVRGGTLSPPTSGAFRDGTGVFFGKEDLGGRAILVRFVIEPVSPDSIRFEQSFSDDGGFTWEVNWIAIDTRIRARE